jgi:hypothetical protein
LIRASSTTCLLHALLGEEFELVVDRGDHHFSGLFHEREDSRISSEHVVGDLRDDLRGMGGERALDSPRPSSPPSMAVCSSRELESSNWRERGVFTMAALVPEIFLV